MKLPFVAALVAVALVAGFLVGSSVGEAESETTGAVVVDETTNVVRRVELRSHGEFTLDVPARLTETWGEVLVSSNQDVVEVVEGGTVRTGDPGTATLSVQNDMGQSIPMFEVTVTD